MHPILFILGPVHIYSYGTMVALGAALAAILVYRRAGRFKIDPEKAVDLIMLSLLVGIVGARLLYVYLNRTYYTVHPMEILDLTRGGLVWYGGFFSALAFAVWYIRSRRMDFWLVTDLVIPYVALAQSFGRIGCFLNGCCYGAAAPSGYPFAVIYPGQGESIYPVQLYASLALLGIYLILRLWQELPHFKGALFLGYGILYPAKRFIVEFYRGDNPRVLGPLTMSQAISLIVFVIATAIFLRKHLAWKRYLESK